MSSKRNRHLALRKSMAGLLSMAMVVTMITPASKTVYASALDDETVQAVAEQEAEAPAEEAAPEEEVADEITDETVDLYAANSVFTNEDVESIQAFTGYNFYGLRLSRIEIQFKDGTNMTGAANAANYKVWDRAFVDGQYEEAGEKGAIESIDVDGFTVTINFSQGPAGNKAFGMMCTSVWAVAEDADGNYSIKGKGDGDGKDYQYFTRENLDLVVGLGAGATMETGIASTDTYGHMLPGTVWQEQDNDIYDDFSITYVDAADEEDATRYQDQDGKVPVHYYVPDTYNEEDGMALVLYVTGNGTSYWEAWDGASHAIGDGQVDSNNLGTNVTYDEAVSNWAETGEVIVASPDVHSDKNKSAAVDVANTIKYFEENYNITKVILSGNSNGTGISSQCVRDFTDLVDVFLDYNGWFADGPNGLFSNQSTWSEEDVQRIAEQGVAIWFFNGEKDPLAPPHYSVDAYKNLIPYYEAAGWSDEWIADNLRISGFKDYKFAEWGVNDHSVTKVVTSNYITSPYTDVYEDGGSLAAGSQYYLSEATTNWNTTADEGVRSFAYTVYGESVSEWALSRGDNKAKVEAVTLTEENVPTIDITRGNHLPLTGYLNQEIQVGDTTRTVKLYIADGAPVRTYMTIINVPEGVDTYRFLEQTGWIDLMNERQEGLFVLEPGEEGWGTVEEEQAYIAAAMAAYNTRKWYSNYSTSYAVGYGEGGAALQAYVMSKPTAFISGVFADADDITADFMTKTAATVNDAQTDILKGDIPVPVWEVNGGNAAVVDYWKNASKTDDGKADGSNTVYTQKDEILMTSYTKGVESKVMVGDVDNVYSADFTNAAYDFMSEYTRYENNWANGNALMLRPDYDELGVEFYEMDLDGYKREYMVYVPESIRNQENIPTVYVMAGNTQTDRVFFDATSWWQVADDYGFMIVLPCEQFNSAVDLTWNITGYRQGSATATSDDVAFLKKVIAEVDQNYSTDTTRRYVTGQSFGSMWTNFCAVYMSDYFAAFGSTSGPIDFAIDENAGTSKVPVWLFAGQYDIFDWDFNKDVTSGVSLKNTINYYLNRNDLGTLEDNVKSVDGRYTTYTWSNEAGIPLYSYTQTAGRNHNCIPSEDRMIWENWFSKWTMTDGIRYYDGQALVDYQDIDEATADVDYSQSARIPLNGWYSKNIDVNGESRSVVMYFPEVAQCRAFFTVVSVPGNVDPVEYLESTGLAAKAAERGEVLVALTAGKDGWGSAEEELDYVNAAMAFVESGKNANGVVLFTNYSTFYFVGVEDGAAPLEAWAVENPIKVVSQVYINGESVGEDYLNTVGSKIYDGTNKGGYDPGIADLDLFKTVLKTQGYDEPITRSEVPVPTMFIGYDENDASVAYWKAANDCMDTADGDTYWQNIDSRAFQTLYANECLGEDAAHGIAKVTVAANTEVTADLLADFMYGYTRYNVPFAYSNHLTLRLDYTEARVEAQKAADAAGMNYQNFVKYDAPITSDLGQTYDGYYLMGVGRNESENGVFESGIVAYADDNNDGGLDAREYLMYIPDSAAGKKVPVVFMFPGMTQNVNVGFDSTQWWQMADKDGAIIVIMGETYNNGAVTLTWKNSDMGYYAVKDIIANRIDGVDAAIDWTRIYGTGHSLGSNQVQNFTHSHPDFFAAVASTSFDTTLAGDYEQIPTMLVIGQSDLPFLVDAANDPLDCDLFTVGRLQNWFAYLAEANDLKVASATKDNADVADETGRTLMYTWNNRQGIPMVRFGQTLLREHNCYPAEVKAAWEFLSKYSLNEDGTRYYSETAFAKNDLVEIEKSNALQEQVTDIQYTIVKNFYGYKVGEVTVTFAEDVDAKALEEATFTLFDRGSANPYFGEVTISDVKVDGNVAILTIDQGSNKTTDRSRNTFGAKTTTGWYMDTEGNIFFGSEDANDELGIAINPNLTGKSCFPRENLDLILCVNSANVQTGLKSTDGHGNLLEDSVWSEIKDESGLDEIELEMVDPGWKAEGYTIVNEMMDTEGKVPVHVIYPEGYDVNRAEKYPVIFYQAGGGVCYWELTDMDQAGVYAPATNLGDNTVYDVMMTKWHEAVPEAIIMSVNVHSNLTESPKEIIGVLQYAIDNWNVDADKIVGVGNSMGTLITSEVLRLRSDLVAAFVECNGNLGGMASAAKLDGTLANSSLGNWSEKEVQAFIENEVSVWMFNGETDGDNPAAQQDVIEIVKGLYREAGKSESWIDGHVRASGLQSWKFKQWGETDHSVTKVVAWNYIENAYTDVNAGQPALAVGDTYRFTGAEANYNKYQYTMDYDYTVYEESVSEWVRNLFAGAYEDPEQPVYTGLEAFVARLYTEVLGRTPDQKGLEAWVKVLKSGSNGGEEVAKGFIFSDEYIRKNTSNADFVEMLYNTLMGRKSDAAGKAAWVAQLDNKTATREKIVEGFIHSDEFIGICDEYGIFTTAAEAFASRLYTKCLGRKYDKAGLKAWADKLHAREIGGGEAAKGFFLSNEFTKKNYSDEEFIARCYRTFLNREADKQGLADWTTLLKKNGSREEILNGFIGSDEFTKLCAQYNIDR